MFRLNADRAAQFRDSPRRRDFLHAGALAGLGLGLADSLSLRAQAAVADNDVSCIMINLTGGPSQLDTWDMKPDAPSGIRGPYRPIKTNVPGMEISEIFPRMAKHADKYAIVRSVYHTAAAVHETGHKLMQTGRLSHDGVEYPHIGSVVSKVKGPKGDLPANAAKECERYGMNRFGQSCFLARRMIEAGVRFVTIDMFETVFHQITWDIHGFKPFSLIGCYRDRVGPMFDMAYSSLLDDLSQRGLLSSTMVVAMGEFGRTPRINPAGGRDHWPECFSVLMAGGPVKGGQIIGSSDSVGGSPKDRPTTPAEIAATIYHGLGIPLDLELKDAQGFPITLVERGTCPIEDLLA